MSGVLVAMSGGVDSSVAACILKEQGYNCIGCTMKLFDSVDSHVKEEKTCCSLSDVEDARSVAFRLGMPHYVFNFKDEFCRKVIEPFAESYCAGRTPNPCIACNRYLKFEKLYERALTLSCGKIATGHYARIRCDGEKYHLLKAADGTKDQSYVLYSLTQEQLSRTLFPLGELSKQETRRLAAEHGFLNSEKPDSQDICFVPDGDYAGFIERLTGRQFPEGDFISPEGRILGRHRGIIHYTVGQRRGLGVPAASRLYVSAIDPVANTVTLTEKSGLTIDTVTVGDVNFISGESFKSLTKVSVRMRYHQKESTAFAETDGEQLILHFSTPQAAPAPGQAAVLYNGEEVLGGGTILHSSREDNK